MAVDPRIALGFQPIQLADPLAQYGQEQNILAAQAQRKAAGTQNELAGLQVSQARLSLQQAQEAHEVVSKIMTAAKENGATTSDPMDAAMQMLRHPNPTVQAAGAHLMDANQKLMTYQQQARYEKDQQGIAPAGQPEAAPAPQFREVPAFGVSGRDMPAEPAAAVSGPPAAVAFNQNRLAPASITAAPVNAMVTPQPMTAESVLAKIKRGNLDYRNSPGWLDERKLLEKQYEQLLKPDVMHVVGGNLVSPSGKVIYQGTEKLEFKEVPQADGTIKYISYNPRTGETSEVKAPGAATGMSAPNLVAQRLAFDKEVEQYKRDHPEKTIYSRTDERGNVQVLAIDKITGKAEPVTLNGQEVIGVDTAAKRLKWEQSNPTLEIKEISDGAGGTKFVAINKQGGTATNVTMSGEPLIGKTNVAPTETAKLISERNQLAAKNPKDPNIAIYDRQIKDMGLARERLNFEQNKFAWEKSHPGFSIQQIEDGSIVGVNNRTLEAFPVTLGAGTTPVAGGNVAFKPGQANQPQQQPIIQPRGEPLKGKSSGLTESQGNATAFGMRMKESHALLKNLENKGETNTGSIRGTVGGTVGLVPLIGDKLTNATDNIFNVLPTILGGMSSEQQQVLNSRINFITAVLRKESGASIAPSEFATAEKLYFPQSGEDATVIKQKQRARELAIQAMEIQAGPGAREIRNLTPGASNTTSASDPLGLFPAKK